MSLAPSRRAPHLRYCLPDRIRAHVLLYPSVLLIILTVNNPAHSEAKTQAYSEFVKALEIVEDNQLTMFTDTPPPTKQETIDDYDARVHKMEARLDKNRDDYKQTIDAKKIEIMRQLLVETTETYNDQYANYIYPDAYQRYIARRNGKFVGVGLKFRTVKNDYPLAIGPLSGGPLQGKDIKPGDKLISVNGKSLKSMPSSKVVATLKGPKNSSVTLVLKRADTEHTIKIKRAAVELHYTDSELLDNNLGYIKVSRFGSKTHLRVEKQLTALIKQGVKGIILDLRDNPGGSTRAARAIVSLFSKESDIYCERYKNGVIKQLHRHGSHKTDLPLVVLINGNSMSSSEIVAGALQSYGRGIIIGSPTFGKGLVQKVTNLAAPLGGAIRTTIAVFGRPDHQIIHAAGIVPDIYVKTDSDFMFSRSGSLNISAEARTFSRKLLEQNIRKSRPDRAEEFIAAKDLQLLSAINKLTQPINSEHEGP